MPTNLCNTSGDSKQCSIMFQVVNNVSDLVKEPDFLLQSNRNCALILLLYEDKRFGLWINPVFYFSKQLSSCDLREMVVKPGIFSIGHWSAVITKIYVCLLVTVLKTKFFNFLNIPT